MQDQQISSLHLKLEPENPKYIAPGEAEVEVLSSSGNITGVKVTGSAYVLMTGKLKI